MRIWPRAVAQTIDEQTTAKFGISSASLMEQAGAAVAEYVLNNFPANRPILVLAGGGNNGGDALVVARLLKFQNRNVTLIEATKPDALSKLQASIPQHNDAIVIDGLVGIGLEGELRAGTFRVILNAVRDQLANKTVIAIDIPSGLDCDHGETTSVPLPADVTITFGGMKPAHVIGPARDLCGDVIVARIGFAEGAVNSALAATPTLSTVDDRTVISQNPWSKLPRHAHKYDRGHVLVIGGSEGKLGAPVLSALAALRAGAGWCSVALPYPAWQKPEPGWPLEITFEAFFDGGKIDVEALTSFIEERRVHSVVIGSGTMKSPLTSEVLGALSKLQQKQGLGIVIDGGALQGAVDLLGAALSDCKRTLLTPHPGEWRRLSRDDLPAPLNICDMVATKRRLTTAGITAIYKNATPIILPADGDGVAIATGGSNILARAGSGDVLAGITAAHLAVGCNADFAAMRSYAVLAEAARIAAKDVGEHAVLATDIIQVLGRV